MHNSDFYLQATALPLLQGLSAEDILQMQERGMLRLISMEEEEDEIIHQGQHCSTLVMLMQGTLHCISEGNGWQLQETIVAPDIIEEESLWSLTRTYTHSYRPAGEGKLLIMEHRHVMQTLAHNEVFRINMLTRLANRLAKKNLSAQPDILTPKSVENKIMTFIQQISCTNGTPKRLTIKMTTLANIIEETRLNVSKALHRMQKNDIIQLGRETITVNRF